MSMRIFDQPDKEFHVMAFADYVLPIAYIVSLTESFIETPMTAHYQEITFSSIIA